MGTKVSRKIRDDSKIHWSPRIHSIEMTHWNGDLLILRHAQWKAHLWHRQLADSPVSRFFGKMRTVCIDGIFALFGGGATPEGFLQK